MNEANFTAPKVGDTVNHVAPNSKKITAAKVVAVDEKTGGRLVTVEVAAMEKDKDGDPVKVIKKTSVTYRPKEPLAGNTWHFALALLALLLSFAPALANLPTYRTFSGYGNATYPATVLMPADPNSQIRIVSCWYTSDNAAGALLLSTGSTAYSVTTSNNMYAGTLTNIINSTNGLSPNAIVMLQHAANGNCYTSSVASFNNTGTNIMPAGLLTNLVNSSITGPAGSWSTNVSYVVLNSVFTQNASVGDDVYLMTAPSPLYLGAGTNSINGDDIYSGNYGRPVMASLTPATATNRLPSISTHYDSASQP